MPAGTYTIWHGLSQRRILSYREKFWLRADDVLSSGHSSLLVWEKEQPLDAHASACWYTYISKTVSYFDKQQLFKNVKTQYRRTTTCCCINDDYAVSWSWQNADRPGENSWKGHIIQVYWWLRLFQRIEETSWTRTLWISQSPKCHAPKYEPKPSPSGEKM